MLITRSASILAGALIILGTGLAYSSDEPANPGKDVFLKYHCNNCHTMKAQGIEKKTAADEETAKDSDRKPPDLSGVGKTRTAAFITKYATKQEKIDGEVHRKKFRGTPAELKSLANWLEQQKADTKDKHQDTVK